jgi:demethylmenaquinone methyltransferase/2-methoxy-6-polyprenyl-1,4-benzoquinol methylase
MFAGIVPSYDLMNRVMSGGQDGRWRSRTVAYARPRGADALDLAAGTGDLALELWRQGAGRIVAADFCEPMLVAAREKLTKRGAADVDLVLADALALPFANQAFDCVVAGFLLRNVADLSASLREMRRVLRPGGRAVSLDLTRPPVGRFNPGIAFYLRRVVPLIGRAVSGHPWAYRYLPTSVDPFPDAESLRRLFQAAGFRQVDAHRAGLGALAIHVALV